MLDKLYRQTVLAVADNGVVKNVAHKQGWKLGVGRFVAGETLADALPALRDISAKGMHPILDLLGEFIDTEAGANAMTEEILGTLDRLEQTSFDRYMSVKPSQLGLGVSFELALENATRVLEKARATQAHICLDMENYEFLEPTLRLYRTLHAQGFTNVSTVLQSYLRRSLDDLKSLLALEPKPTLRIVKGAYKESPEVAFQDKADVDAQYRKMVYAGLTGGAHVNVATHDESIIDDVKTYLQKNDLKPTAYEFQLLFGVKQNLQARLTQEGHTVRIYVPYGEDWYGYFSRRLAERPANLMFVLRGLTG